MDFSAFLTLEKYVMLQVFVYLVFSAALRTFFFKLWDAHGEFLAVSYKHLDDELLHVEQIHFTVTSKMYSGYIWSIFTWVKYSSTFYTSVTWGHLSAVEHDVAALKPRISWQPILLDGGSVNINVMFTYRI